MAILSRLHTGNFRAGMPALIALLLLAGCGNSIHDHARWGHAQEVGAMLDRAPELLEARDPMEKTPLFFAVTFNQTAMVTLLLDRGADVNARDLTGLTPLHVAASLNLEDQIRLLLDRGAAIEARDDFGDTPLHVAAYTQQEGAMRLLAARGADLDAKNKAGLTPEGLAREKAMDQAAELLAALRADKAGGRGHDLP